MKLKLSRKKFFDGYKAKFGAFSAKDQPTIDGIEFFLTKFERETRLKNIPQFAYVLATAFHESHVPRTGVHFQPVKEMRERASSPRRANQDKYWLTGYYGRGFPQTTWEENYLKSGKALGLGDLFVKNPDLLLQPEYAYEAMVICMVKGLYRKGKTLNKFLPDDDATLDQLINARDIINGDIRKNGKLIAGHAIFFDNLLRISILSNSQLEEVATSQNTLDLPHSEFREPPSLTTSAEALPEPLPEKEWQEGTRPAEGQETVAPVETVIPVIQAVAEKTEEKPESALSKAESTFTWINGKILALPPAIGSAILGAYAWITSAPMYLIIGFFAASALIGITYLSWFMFLKNQREKREAAERIEVETTKRMRELQAHEITKLQMESAMRKDYNTVAVVPKPLENSDSEDSEKLHQQAPKTQFRQTRFLGQEF